MDNSIFVNHPWLGKTLARNKWLWKWLLNERPDINAYLNHDDPSHWHPAAFALIALKVKFESFSVPDTPDLDISENLAQTAIKSLRFITQNKKVSPPKDDITFIGLVSLGIFINTNDDPQKILAILKDDFPEDLCASVFSVLLGLSSKTSQLIELSFQFPELGLEGLLRNPLSPQEQAKILTKILLNHSQQAREIILTQLYGKEPSLFERIRVENRDTSHLFGGLDFPEIFLMIPSATIKLITEPGEALNWYSRLLISLEDKQALVLANMADQYAASNQLKDADLCWQRAVEYAPNSISIQNGYVQFLLKNALSGPVNLINSKVKGNMLANPAFLCYLKQSKQDEEKDIQQAIRTLPDLLDSYLAVCEEEKSKNNRDNCDVEIIKGIVDGLVAEDLYTAAQVAVIHGLKRYPADTGLLAKARLVSTRNKDTASALDASLSLEVLSEQPVEQIQQTALIAEESNLWALAFEKRLQLFEFTILENGNATVDSCIKLAKAALEIGNPGFALEVLSHLPGESIGDKEEFISGLAHHKLGNIDTAIEHINRAIVANPIESKYHILLSNIVLEKGNPDKARSILEQAVVATHSDPEILLELGKAFLQEQQFTSAAQRLEEAINLDCSLPIHIDIAVNLARALVGAGKEEEGLNLLKCEHEMYPSAKTVTWLYGDLLAQHDEGKAIEILGTVLQDAETPPKYLISYIRSCLNTGLISEKIHQLIIDVQANPRASMMELAELSVLRAELLCNINKWKAAQESLNDPSLTNQANSNPALKKKAFHLQGAISIALGDYDKAISTLQDALKTFEPDIEIQKLLSKAYMLNGKPKQGLLEAVKVISQGDRVSIPNSHWFCEEILLNIINDSARWFSTQVELIRNTIIPTLEKVAYVPVSSVVVQTTIAAMHFLTNDKELATSVLDKIEFDIKGVVSQKICALYLLLMAEANLTDKAISGLENRLGLQAGNVLRQSGHALDHSELDITALLINLYLSRGEYDKLQTLVSQLKDLDGEYKEKIIETKVRILIENKGEYDNAIEFIKALANTYEATPGIALQLAKAHYWKGEASPGLTHLEECFESVLNTNTNDKLERYILFLEITKTALLAQESELAWKALESAEHLEPEIFFNSRLKNEHNFLRGILAIDNNQTLLASEAVERLTPSNEAALYANIMQARLLVRKLMYAEAKATLHEIQNSIKQRFDPLLHLQTAKILLEIGSWDIAVETIVGIPNKYSSHCGIKMSLLQAIVFRMQGKILCKHLGAHTHLPDDRKSSDYFNLALQTADQLNANSLPEATRERVRSFTDDLHEQKDPIRGPEGVITNAKNILSENHSDLFSSTNNTVVLPGFYNWSSAFIPPLYFGLLSSYAEENNHSQYAAICMEAGLSLWPDEANWHYRAAELMHPNIQTKPIYEKAVMHYEHAILSSPLFEKAYLAAANLHTKFGDVDRAIQKLKAASIKIQNQPRIWLALAQIYFHSGNLAEAIRCLNKVIHIDNQHVDALTLRAELALQINDPETAIVMTRKALLVKADNPELLILLSRALEAVDRDKEAIEALTYASRLLGYRSVELILEIVRLHHKNGNYSAAFDLLISNCEGHGEEPKILAAMGETLDKMGNFKDGVDAARRALALSLTKSSEIEQSDYHYLVGKILHKTGNYSEAVAQLEASLNKNPDNLDALLELGLAYKNARLSDNALALFEKAIRIAPIDPRPYHFAGIALKEAKDFEEAELMLNHAAKLAPNDIDIMRHLASVKAVNILHNWS